MMAGVRLPVMPPVGPMLAKSVKAIPTGDYLYEPKWDGFRCIVFRDGDEVELTSRGEKPLTRYFPEVVEALRENLPYRCVVDGEIVIATDDRLDFEALLQRIHPAKSRVDLLAAETPASFVAFDLLAVDDGHLQHGGVSASFTMKRRAELVDELAPYAIEDLTGHLWQAWAEAEAHEQGRLPGAVSRWNASKDLSWVPVRPDLVVEVKYDH